MLKANELRTGNFVLHNGSIIVIDGIDRSNESVMVEDKHIPIPLTDIEPIPLTHEWLERLGFEKGAIVNNNEYEIEQPYILKIHEAKTTVSFLKETYGGTEEKRIRFYFDYDLICLGRSLVHVHHLQNLYFALTGEELTIKETV